MMTSRFDKPPINPFSRAPKMEPRKRHINIQADAYELLYARRKIRMSARLEYVVMACNAGDPDEVATIHVFEEHLPMLQAAGVDLGAIVRGDDNGSIPEGVYVRIRGDIKDARLLEVL